MKIKQGKMQTNKMKQSKKKIVLIYLFKQEGYFISEQNGFISAQISKIGISFTNETYSQFHGFFIEHKLFIISISFRMANKTYTKYQLKLLLEAAQQEVLSTLLNPSDHSNKYFYQNFTLISIKIMKYVNNFLNSINSDQIIGKLIDHLFLNLSQSLKDYKSRNIYTHSTYTQQSELQNDEDQIYHFLNTRNNHIPVQCLNNYENQRQRMELQQFVQEMSKHSKINIRQPKRSLILPKENNFKLKLGRKATFDTQLRSIQQETIQKTQNKFSHYRHQPQDKKICEHAQIQTDIAINIYDQRKRYKTVQVDTESQCESMPMFQQTFQSLSSRRLNGTNKKKSKPKKKIGDKEGNKSKKKIKTNTPSSISFKQSMQILKEYQQEQKEQDEYEHNNKQGQCSIKTVNCFLNICNKAMNLTIIKSQIVDHLQSINQTLFLSQTQKALNQEQSQICDKSQSLQSFSYNLTNNVSQVQKVTNQDKIKEENQQPLSKIQIAEIEVGQDPIRQSQKQKIVYHQNLSKFNPKAKNKYDFIKQKLISDHVNSQQPCQQSQKIPISTVKILQNYQFQLKNLIDSRNYKPESEHNSRSQHILSKNSNKRKTFTNSKFFLQQSNENQSQLGHISRPKNIKKSILNMSKMDKLKHLKKESIRSDHKSSLTGKNQISNISQATSQDYLKSRQKIPQQQLITKLMQIQKKENLYENCIDAINEGSANNNVKGPSAKDNKWSRQNSRRQMPSISKSPVQNQNLMIVFSSKARSPQASQNRDKNMVINNKEKDNPSNFSGQKRGQQRHQSKIQNVKSELISIDEGPKSQQCINLSRQSPTGLQKFRSKQCRTVDPSTTSPKRTALFHRSTQITPLKTSMSKLKSDLCCLNSSKSHKKMMNSTHESRNSEQFQFNDLKRKLRNRVYKDKLTQYLELIETTHTKFCGKDCDHITELFKGKQGTVAQQILRLFKRYK